MKNKIFAVVLFGIVTLSLSSCYEQTTDSSGIESKLISVNKGVEIKNLYSKDIGTLIDEKNGNGYQHTEYAWVSLDTLKKYVALLEEVGNLNQKEVSGIRIYMAKYPLEGKYSEKERNNLKPGRETLFFAPTMKIEAKDSISKKYQVLQNVPFSIKPTDPKKPYIGSFEEIKALSFPAPPSKVSIAKTMQELSVTESNTSLFMNELQNYPPPKNN